MKARKANKPAAPTPSARAVVNAHGVNRLRAGHPWIFRSDIDRVELAEPGGVVRVEDQKGKVWGSALYGSTSQIALRMISTSAVEEEKYPELLRYRIRQAIAYRQRVVEESDAFRVLFSEADLVPGVIVDKYNDLLSVQVLSEAMDRERARSILIEELVAAYAPQTILERVDERIRELEGLPAREDQAIY